MDFDKKIKRFEESCKKLAEAEAEKIENELNSEIENQIDFELEDYIKKQEISYKRQSEKVVKEHNKELFDFEIECKKNILNVKDIIKKNLLKELEDALYKFVKQKEYEIYLIKSINEALDIVNNDRNSIVYITNKDYIENKELIMNKFNCNLKSIDNNYIGGCKLENKEQGVLINNTLRYKMENCDIYF